MAIRLLTAALFMALVAPVFGQSQSLQIAVPAECNPLHEEFRLLDISKLDKDIQRERAQRNPRTDRIEQYEKQIAIARRMDGATYFGSIRGLMGPGQMETFMRQLSLKDLMARIDDSRKMLSALESGNLAAYAAIKGMSPSGPDEVAQLRAAERSSLCASMVHLSQSTRKPMSAEVRNWLGIGSPAAQIVAAPSPVTPSAPREQPKDFLTKRCEVRAGCEVFVSESWTCRPVPTHVGGSCIGGLLQGTAFTGSGSRPGILRYEAGRAKGIFLTPANVPPDSSGAVAFTLYELDESGKAIPGGDGRYVCTFLPNGKAIDTGATTNALCERASEWLGPSYIAAAVSGTWRLNAVAATGQQSPGSPGGNSASAVPSPATPSVSREQPSPPAQSVTAGAAGSDTTPMAPQGRWDDKRCLAEMGRINSDYLARQIPASVKGMTGVQALQLDAQYSAGPMKLLFEGPCAGYSTAKIYVSNAIDVMDRAERASRTGVAEPDLRQMKSRLPGKLSDAECQAKVAEIHQEITVFGAGARNANETLELAYRYQGIPQKLLFEGPCASHPQASSFLATANKIIDDAERVLGVKVGVTRTTDNRNAAADYSDRQKIIASSGEPAHQCLGLIQEGLYGGFSNSCSFKVYYTYCAFHPRKGTWVDSASFNCESSQYTTPRSGGQTVGANGQDANHTRGAEKIFWFACKAPSHPYQVRFNGSQLVGSCRPESS